MKIRMRLIAVLALTCLGVAQPRAQVAPTDALFKKMIAAVQSSAYETFVADGSPAFQTGLTKAAFGVFAAQLRPRFDAGYTAQYLTSMNKGGVTVHLWKLVFKDGKDDMLAAMALDGSGKVAGFLAQ